MTARRTLCGRLPDFPPLQRAPSDGVPPERSVRLADLDQVKKRAVWGWIKHHDPSLAAVLQCPDVRMLLDAFPGSSPVVDLDVVRKALA